MNHKTVVIGIGNPLLTDDRAGIEVAEKLEAMGVKAQVEVIYSVGFEVIDKLMGYERAFVIDAAKLGGKPGDIHTFTAQEMFATTWIPGTHAVTLGATLKSGYSLFEDELPKDMRLFLIEAGDVSGFCDTCTPPVAASVEKVITLLADEIGVTGPEGSVPCPA